MSEDTEKERKRAFFNQTDVQLLLECAKTHANILENKKTNGITLEAKKKAWDQIVSSYNAGQTGGMRSLKELQNKYKNEKKNWKQQLSSNAKEIRQTGGGSARVVTIEAPFDFSPLQLEGLHNPYDEDTVGVVIQSRPGENDGVVADEGNVSMTSQEILTYRNKKMKMTTGKDELIELKTEGMRLDNMYKQKVLDNEAKTGEKLDLMLSNEVNTGKKLDLDIRKAELEVEKLERELYPDEYL